MPMCETKKFQFFALLSLEIKLERKGETVAAIIGNIFNSFSQLRKSANFVVVFKDCFDDSANNLIKLNLVK